MKQHESVKQKTLRTVRKMMTAADDLERKYRSLERECLLNDDRFLQDLGLLSELYNDEHAAVMVASIMLEIPFTAEAARVLVSSVSSDEEFCERASKASSKLMFEVLVQDLEAGSDTVLRSRKKFKFDPMPLTN